MSDSVSQIRNLLLKSNKIFIVPHISPDGDCLGSALGLAWALRQLNKDVTVAIDDYPSASMSYLPGFDELGFKTPSDQDLFIFLDASDSTRYGRLFDLARATLKPVIEIDHHATNTYYGDYNWVDTSASACAVIIYQLITSLPAVIDQKIALCLLTGIITDTLGFRTSDTSPRALEIAIELMKAGASISFVVERVFNNRTLDSLQLLGRVLSQAKMDDSIIWSQITKDDLKMFHLNTDSNVGVISLLRTVAEAKIAVLFTEEDGGLVNVDFRAQPNFDVSEVALRLGGGGHKQASGALIDGPLPAARARVLAEIKRSLANP